MADIKPVATYGPDEQLGMSYFSWCVNHEPHKRINLYDADALTAARNAALEEAAKVCDAVEDDFIAHGQIDCAAGAGSCAAAIRALKSPAPPGDPSDA